METSAIERSISIRAPRQEVWRAITEPEHLEQWYAPGCRWEIPALRVGETIKFYNTETDIQPATIEVLEPLHEITLRWQLDPADPQTTLTNTFRLEAENGNTRVTVIQAGYEALPGEIRTQQFSQDLEAHAAIVESLKAYLEQ